MEQDAGPEDIYLNGIEMARNGRNLKKKKLVKVAASPQWWLMRAVNCSTERDSLIKSNT